MIELAAGDVRVTLAPAVGGSVARLTWRGIDVLRPAPAGSTDPLEMAAFPLVPWSNRIRDARFEWRGDRVEIGGLPPHALHGFGWRSEWAPRGVAATTARLDHVHHGGDRGWPWTYHASQDFIVQPDALEWVLAVTNRSDTPMPAGLGWHPSFVKPPGTQLTTALDGWWETDGDILPTRRVDRAGENWNQWLFATTGVTDNVFTGFGGEAAVATPAVRTTIVSGAAARWLVIYAPTGSDFACIEPVTHPTDALNMDGRPGVATLAPGETLALGVALRFATPSIGIIQRQAIRAV